MSTTDTINPDCPIHGRQIQKNDNADQQSTIDELKAQVQSLRADLIRMQTDREKQRFDSIHGKGLTQPNGGLTKQDFASVRDERIAQANLAEVVQLQAELDGVKMSNDREWGTYCGLDGYGPSLEQTLRGRK